MAEIENERWYASNGKGNLGVTLGAIGTGLGVLSPHFGGLFNGNGYGYGYGRNVGYESAVCVDRPVGKETFELQQRVSRLESEKALLASEQNTEVKLADVYERVARQALDQERINNAKWTEQLVWNARQDSRIAVLERDVRQLYSMTGLYVEASKVTPLPMDRYNSWTAPVTAEAPATT